MWPLEKKNPAYTAEYPTKGLVLSDVVEVKTEEITSKAKYKDCDIEYMPISNRYYPRYKGKYIYFWSYGAVSLEEDIPGCKYGESKSAAMKIIDLYLERVGITSEIIKI